MPEPVPNIIVGQPVTEEKLIRAKQLRREMTPAERRVWGRLRANRLGGLRFRRQQVIDGFIADFYCHAAAVVVEIDGPVHDGREGYDTERDRIFRARGFLVLRFTNAEVEGDLDGLIGRIAAACLGSVPPPRFGEGG